LQNLTLLVHFFLCLASAPADVKDFNIFISLSPGMQSEKIEVRRINPDLFEMSVMKHIILCEIHGTKMSLINKNNDKEELKIDLSRYLDLSRKTDFQKISEIASLSGTGKKEGFYRIIREANQVRFEYSGSDESAPVSFYLTYSTTPSSSPKYTLNLSQCFPETKTIAFGLGSMLLQIVGKSQHGCVVMYGIEIENPRWDGFLSHLCVIPKSIGVYEFGVSVNGPDLSFIAPYCVSTPESLRPQEKDWQ